MPRNPGSAPIADSRKRSTAAEGTATAMPPTIIELMPTTRPAASTIGPPELPGARRRSARIACCNGTLFSTVVPAVLSTIPAVTEPRTPQGLPMAKTTLPTFSAPESPGSRGSSPVASICSAARSWEASRAMTFAAKLRSSQVTTSAVSPETTWLLVMISPSADQMVPEPTPSRLRTATRLRETRDASSPVAESR